MTTIAAAQKLVAQLAAEYATLEGYKADMASYEAEVNKAWQVYESRKSALFEGVGTVAELREELYEVENAIYCVSRCRDCISDIESEIADLKERLANKLEYLELDWMLR